MYHSPDTNMEKRRERSPACKRNSMVSARIAQRYLALLPDGFWYCISIAYATTDMEIQVFASQVFGQLSFASCVVPWYLVHGLVVLVPSMISGTITWWYLVPWFGGIRYHGSMKPWLVVSATTVWCYLIPWNDGIWYHELMVSDTMKWWYLIPWHDGIWHHDMMVSGTTVC